jgi:hypothetical protein
MFNIDLLEGNPGSALDGPDKILYRKTEIKYFGTAGGLGKKLVYREPPYSRTFEVTGIFREFPANSHLIINHLVSYATLGSMARQDGDTTNSTETSFGWYDFYTYLQLRPGTDLKKFEDKLPAYCDRYMNKKEWQKQIKYIRKFILFRFLISIFIPIITRRLKRTGTGGRWHSFYDCVFHNRNSLGELYKSINGKIS